MYIVCFDLQFNDDDDDDCLIKEEKLNLFH